MLIWVIKDKALAVEVNRDTKLYISDCGDMPISLWSYNFEIKGIIYKIHRSISTVKVFFANKIVCRSVSSKINILINLDILMVLISYTYFVKV